MDLLLAAKAEMEKILSSPEFLYPDCKSKAKLKEHESYISGFQAALDIILRQIEAAKKK